MYLSARAEYACLAMIELAARAGDPKPVRLADIADTHGIPQRFLVQILLQLKGAGLIASTRGASGGYQLARKPDEVTLADILAVVDRAEPPAERATPPSAVAGGLQAVWKRLASARETILAETTLADLVPTDGIDYMI